MWRGGFEEIHFLLSIPGHLTLCQTSPYRWGKLLLQSTGRLEPALGCAGEILQLGPLLVGKKKSLLGNFGLKLIRILKIYGNLWFKISKR